MANGNNAADSDPGPGLELLETQDYSIVLAPSDRTCFSIDVPYQGDVELYFRIEDPPDPESKDKKRDHRAPPSTFVTVKSPEGKNVFDRPILPNGKEERVGSLVRGNKGKRKYGEYQVCWVTKSIPVFGRNEDANMPAFFKVKTYERKRDPTTASLSEKANDDAQKRNSFDFVRKEHLNPVERTFENAKNLASSVLSEMDYIKVRVCRWRGGEMERWRDGEVERWTRRESKSHAPPHNLNFC